MSDTDSKPVDTGRATFSHLRSTTSSQRLSQIEKVRANGIGEVIALPQLAVCGDQSAGKSSVLEGITGIPFPRQDGLCTRFPTEIILRHSETAKAETIIASIRPHFSRPGDQQMSLASYHKTLGSMSELPAVIDEASKLMGLRDSSAGSSGPAFAPDALRIEISGPIGLQLSIVDLPGLISVASEEQTEEDVRTVHNMAEVYMHSSRTIILAVVQATNVIANQSVIKTARKHDPEEQRTVGIITKPDLINKGTEPTIANFAKNQGNIKLKLGFFLLKNPSPTELKACNTMSDRSALELGFFRSPVWASQHLDTNRIGADRLRQFLQTLLDTHIERELPKVRSEIKKKLATTETETKAMGSARPTVGDIRSFLTGLSLNFHQLLQAALNGNYQSTDHGFSDTDPDARLRARIQMANRSFADTMHKRGQLRVVKGNSKDDAADLQPSPQDGLSSDDDEALLDDDPSLAQLFVTTKELMEWVKQVHSRTRGKELPGNHNPALLAELFHEQSRRWSKIAEIHVRRVQAIASRWKDHAIQTLIPEDKLRNEIEASLQDWLDRAEQLALDELSKLVEDEHRGPLTYNHYYTDNIQHSRLDARKKGLVDAVTSIAKENHNLDITHYPDHLTKFLGLIPGRITIDMEEQACQEALTQLKAYYKVALKTFIDNVARQVIERHIVAPFSTAFSPNSVAELSEEDLVRIGSEPEHETARRTSLMNMAKALRKSLIDLQRPAK